MQRSLGTRREGSRIILSEIPATHYAPNAQWEAIQWEAINDTRGLAPHNNL